MRTLEVNSQRSAGDSPIPGRAIPLACLGGEPLFDLPRSASNLAAPAIERFLAYSRIFFDAKRYTNSGPVNAELERRLAEFHETRHCVSFASGFWALVLAIKALALPGRTEVVMPSLTYRRMADVVSWAGLVPHYCEVEPETLAASAGTMQPCIGRDTALLLGVHPIVNCCPATELEELAAAHHLPLLIDAVESCYETTEGRRVGSFGNAEVFSLHASKLLNGFEGGYVTTDDEALAEELSLLRGFGFFGHDNIVTFGTNAKLNEMHAAMALAGLDEIDEQIPGHRDRYHAYRSALEGVAGLRLRRFDESERCSYKNIVVELLDDWPLTRSATLAALQAERILARPYYSPALHQKRASYRSVSGPLPVTDSLAERFILLPSGSRVSPEDIHGIVGVLSAIRHHAAEVSAWSLAS